ncbi:helix-turn-helix transcriptional regulator [Dokdonella sp.]|uniref:helix-turn-helix transcriptional regulator n=1 Tax=Dokdonella sp. TaxID=2291710 RepID=UPI002626165D|nr:helix-turn-helix transcriptional regulator [Dokdonella sp.]
MPRRRAQQQAIARLHQMACLDFSGPQLVASVLHELRRVVAFDSGGYFHPGDGGLLDAYLESPAVQAVMPDYFDPRILRSESRILCRSLLSFTDIARYQRGPWALEPGQILTVPRAALYRSEYYEAIMRPADLSTWVAMVLCTPQGRGLGLLTLYRNTGAPPFAREEVDTLARLEACLARALQPGELDADDSEVQSSGLLVVTREGRLLWISPEAEHLLPLAFGWRWRAVGAAAASAGGPLPQVLQRLLHQLRWVRRGKTDASLPQMEWHNASGWFSLRATQLTAAGGEPLEDAVALHITRRVARGTRLLAALQPLALSGRQHEMAYWMARGCAESQIAMRMGISAPTVVYHRRALYERLQVQDRQGLLTRLHAMTPARA